MAETIINSDFLNKVVDAAKELSAIAESATDGKNRAIIILAAEEVSETASANIVSICGRQKEAISALHDFATQPQTADVFKKVAFNVAMSNIIKH